MSTNQITRRPALDPAILTTLAEVSTNATNAFASASMSTGNVAAALEVAGAIEDLRALFDRPDIQARIVALQDSAIGFRTDKDPKVWNKKANNGQGAWNTPYPYPVVKDCAIEATLRGLQLVGNQFNIISARCYVSREGFEYLIKRRKEVTNFLPIVNVPQMRDRGCLVECEATWDNAGTKQHLKVTIPVKAEDYGTADQYIGKATRKFLKRCYEIMTGNVLPEGDAEDAGDSPETLGQPAQPALPPAPIPKTEAARAPRAARPLTASTAAAVPEPPPKKEKAPVSAPEAPPPVDPLKETQPVAGEVGDCGGLGIVGPTGVSGPPNDNPGPAGPAFDTTEEAKAPEDPKERKPWEVTEDLLMSAKVPLNDFFQWLETTGRVKDGSIYSTVSETPVAVLAEILKDNCAALRKCIRLYGA